MVGVSDLFGSWFVLFEDWANVKVELLIHILEVQFLTGRKSGLSNSLHLSAFRIVSEIVTVVAPARYPTIRHSATHGWLCPGWPHIWARFLILISSPRAHRFGGCLRNIVKFAVCFVSTIPYHWDWATLLKVSIKACWGHVHLFLGWDHAILQLPFDPDAFRFMIWTQDFLEIFGLLMPDLGIVVAYFLTPLTWMHWTRHLTIAISLTNSALLHRCRSFVWVLFGYSGPSHLATAIQMDWRHMRKWLIWRGEIGRFIYNNIWVYLSTACRGGLSLLASARL
jgi:hypothetical protein